MNMFHLATFTVPIDPDAAYECPTCKKHFRRSGWNIYESRNEAIGSLFSHLQAHSDHDYDLSHKSSSTPKPRRPCCRRASRQQSEAPRYETCDSDVRQKLRNHLLWQRAKETVPDDSRELYKCPLCTDYVKHCWIDHKSRQHAVSDLYHHLQNHGGKDMHRSEIPPHQAHVGTYQADMLHSTPQIDRGLTQSNNQSPQVISFVATEACSGGAPLLPDNTCHLNSTALGSCDSDTESEQEESELPTSIGDPQFIRTTYGKVQSIVPTQKDEPYSCPLCASYSRPGWKFYNSRQSAINNLQQHFQQHIHQTRTHSDPRSPKATLSDQVAMLRAVLMAPAFAGGVVPCCRNNLAAQRNYKSTRERTVNILYQHLRGCCGCSKESEEVNTSTMQQQDFSAREASAPAFSSLELPVDSNSEAHALQSNPTLTKATTTADEFQVLRSFQQKKWVCELYPPQVPDDGNTVPKCQFQPSYQNQDTHQAT